MKKRLTIILIFIMGITTAQEISYGLFLGGNIYDIINTRGDYDIINNNEPTAFTTESRNLNASLTYGGYVEYNFTNKIGLKTDVLFSKKEFVYFSTKQPFEMNMISVAPNFKYDFGEIYREGFYMLAGPKFTFITSTKSEEEDVKDSFESFIVGAQLGFGCRVLKFIDLQTKLQYDILPFFKLENGNKSNFIGGIVSANIDITKLISN